MNILLLASHAVAEYDDLRMLTDLGYDVFAPGGYEVPSRSGEGIRPALPDAPHHPELVERLNETRASFRAPAGRYIDWGKARLHSDIIDWADVIIAHHFVDVWLGEQWDRLKGKRVIWRTCGQSDPSLEQRMKPLVADGLQVVRYSPRERIYFEKVGSFAGEDAVIRFGKYPDDFEPWLGTDTYVGNVTQWRGHEGPLGRGNSVGLDYFLMATQGLPLKLIGDGSDALPGGMGKVPYDGMLEYLRHLRVYLYTGTTPASYTLGLMEAMFAGVPIVSIGPGAWGGPDDLFEGHRFANAFSDNAAEANQKLRAILSDDALALACSRETRRLAELTFGIEAIGAQWKAFLG